MVNILTKSCVYNGSKLAIPILCTIFRWDVHFVLQYTVVRRAWTCYMLTLLFIWLIFIKLFDINKNGGQSVCILFENLLIWNQLQRWTLDDPTFQGWSLLLKIDIFSNGQECYISTFVIHVHMVQLFIIDN
jgi:hypothetical protein